MPAIKTGVALNNKAILINDNDRPVFYIVNTKVKIILYNWLNQLLFIGLFALTTLIKCILA